MSRQSNTKRSSTVSVPQLERLLLDTDVNVSLEPLLQAVGFRTEFALRVSVNERNDRQILRWARQHRYIYVCHDKFKDKQTRLEIYPGIYDRGGKVIQIRGREGPAQDVYKSLGKILLHRKEWKAWFEEHQRGIVTVSTQRMNGRTARELYTVVQAEMPLAADPETTLRYPSTRRRTQQPQTLLTPLEQERLL